MKPPRLTKISDLWRHPSYDLSHPYNVNFIGTKNIVDACKLNNVRKVIRLTGALTGKPATLPFVILFNLLLSFSPKWHEKSEKYIRQSGLNYTCVRPTELKNNGPASETNRNLILIQGDSDKRPPIPGMISINDVSDLCILSAIDPYSKFDCSSVVCSSTVRTDNSENYKDWMTLSNELELQDYKPLEEQPHTKIALLSGLLLTVSLASLLRIAFSLVTMMFRVLLGWQKVLKYVLF